MKSPLRWFASCFVILAAVSCGTGDPGAPVILPGSPAVRESGIDARIHAFANSGRASIGRNTLVRSAELDALAADHLRFSMRRSEGKAPVLDHAGMQGRLLLANQRIGASVIGENIHCIPGGGRDPARKIVDDWWNSAVHRRNLAGVWSHAGVAAAKDSAGRVWAVQIYAMASGS